MSDERARDEEKKGARRAPDAVPDRGLGLGREGHGGVLLPDGHEEAGPEEREQHEERKERKRQGRGARRGRDPYDDEDQPDEASDR